MYELKLSDSEYKEFALKCRYVMAQRGISRKMLSERTGYSIHSINAFFSGRNSRFVAAAISKALGMEKKYEVQKSNADSIS